MHLSPSSGKQLQYMQLEKTSAQSIGAHTTYVQRKINQIVKYHVKRGMCPPHNQDDIAQDLYLNLLEGRWSTICRKYDAKRASFDYYLGKLLHYDCLRIYSKKTYNHLGTDDLDNFIQQLPEASIKYDGGMSKEATSTLNQALTELALDAPKYRLLLKIHGNKPLQLADLKAYAPQIPAKKLKAYLKHFNQPYSLRHKEDSLKLILPLINEVEHRNTSLSAIQRMLSRRVQKLEKWLSKHTSYSFESESIKNLLYICL